MRPAISTIVVNQNSAGNLRKYLESYRYTISVPSELIIIDNNSTDGSRDIIRDFHSNLPKSQVVMLQENRGADAFNLGLAKSSGMIVHLSEGGHFEYLPGWSNMVVDFFSAFPSLGQLSPFGPTSDSIQTTSKSSSLRHSRERIVYEESKAIPIFSFLRREIRERGTRVRSLQSGSNALPDENGLSDDVRAAGYFVAWAERDLVRSSVGLAQGSIRRKSFLFPRQELLREKSDPHDDCPNPHWWSMIDGWTAEVEALEFLYGLVRLLKPASVLETGTWHGYASIAVGRALKANGFGHMTTLETDVESYSIAVRNIMEEKLEEVIRCLNLPSLEFTPDDVVDLLFLDSELGIRGDEFSHFLPYLKQGSIIVFHDTNAIHETVRAQVAHLLDLGLIERILLPSPRGLALCQRTGKVVDR